MDEVMDIPYSTRYDRQISLYGHISHGVAIISPGFRDQIISPGFLFLIARPMFSFGLASWILSKIAFMIGEIGLSRDTHLRDDLIFQNEFL
jgi:hypothetical protein